MFLYKRAVDILFAGFGQRAFLYRRAVEFHFCLLVSDKGRFSIGVLLIFDILLACFGRGAFR